MKARNDNVYSVWRQKRFDDGRIAEVIDLMGGRARIILYTSRYSLDDGW